MFLGADIGGTKTNLALFEQKQDQLTIFKQERYKSQDHKNLDEIVQEFLSKNAVKIERAAFGIAGPVQNETVQATNLPWIVRATSLSQLTKCPVHLINDLEANAWGIRVLKEDECHLLQKGDPSILGNQALISAGTGLGEAGLYFEDPKHLPFACEGGHVDFAPRDERDLKLWGYLHKKRGHVSYERVLSGQGLVNLYHYLVEVEKIESSKSVQEEMQKLNPGKVISDHALHQSDLACTEALLWMISLYGSAAGNLALKFMAKGGVFLGGGIAPKILPWLEKEPFLKAFSSKGRFESFLKQIPIKVILNDQTALLGAGECAYHWHQKKA